MIKTYGDHKMYENITKSIIQSISDRIKDVKIRKGLSRKQILLENPGQVSNIIHSERTKRYPYLLAPGIIKQLISNKQLPFKSQGELLWGINEHEEIDWKSIFANVIEEYCTTNISKGLLLNKVLLNDVQYAKLKAVWDEKDFVVNNPIHANYILEDLIGYIPDKTQPYSIDYFLNKLHGAEQMSVSYEFDLPSLKNPDLVYRHNDLLSASKFKEKFLREFKNNPLVHFQKHFMLFANHYMKDLLIKCYKDLKQSPLSFGLQAYKSIYTNLDFQIRTGYSILDSDVDREFDDSIQYNISTGEGTESDYTSTTEKYWNYTIHHVQKLEEFQKEFNKIGAF